MQEQRDHLLGSQVSQAGMVLRLMAELLSHFKGGVHKAVLMAVPLAVCLAGCASKTVVEDTMLPPEKPREEVQRVIDHYPAGEISSVAKADEILEVVHQEKKNVEARLYNEKMICNDKYLVYACYEEVESQKRADLRALTMLEAEAKRYKRADDVRQRDLNRDIKEMDEIANAPDRYESIKSHEEKLKRIHEKQAEREQAARGITKTPKEKHEGNLMTPKEKAENVKAYKQKQENKKKRMQQVEENRARTAKRREEALKRQEEEAKKREELRKAREKAAKRRSTF